MTRANKKGLRVAEHLVLPVMLGVIHSTLSTLQCCARGIIRADPGEAAADGETPDLRKIEFFDVGPETLKCSQHQGLIRAMHQHRKLLATKAVQAVISAEGVVHDARHQQQDLLSNQMPMLVVNDAVTVDRNRTEPIVGGHPMTALLSCRESRLAGCSRGFVHLAHFFEHSAVKGVVQRFSIQ